jgi:membrane protein required for beta-lactamase induction
MQTVLALIVAVLIDWWARHLPGGQFILRCRTVNWFGTYVSKLMELVGHYKITNNYLVALALYVPLLAGLVLLQLLFSKMLGPTGNLLFLIITLVYFLSNKDLNNNDSEFVQAHETSFAVLFWFAILGPVGALTYWFLAVFKQVCGGLQDDNASLYKTLNWLHAMAAWIPARITGFIYALVGNFTRGFNSWLQAMRSPNLPSSDFLIDCGNAATDPTVADDGANLVERAFIAWVVISIILVMIK